MRIRELRGAVLLGALAAGPALAQDTFEQSGDVAQMPSGSYYIVQPGDTLWDISQKFLGDPYYWPKLWSYNDAITNPHWIYPGNVIYFSFDHLGPDLPRDPPPDGPIEILGEVNCGPDVRFTEEWADDTYPVQGFLAERRDVEVWGEVEHARSGYTYLSEGELLYLKMEDPDAFSCDDTVTIFRKTRKKVRHPDRRRSQFGDLYTIVAEATVVHRYGDYVTAQIRQSFTEVERGDLVGPPTPVDVTVDVRNPDGDLNGTIVEILRKDPTLYATREVVFLDRGRADGLRVGNSFYITRQQDEWQYPPRENRELPPSVVGRVVVVKVDEYSSTAIITDANREIIIGDRVTMEVD